MRHDVRVVWSAWRLGALWQRMGLGGAAVRHDAMVGVGAGEVAVGGMAPSGAVVGMALEGTVATAGRIAGGKSILIMHIL